MGGSFSFELHKGMLFVSSICMLSEYVGKCVTLVDLDNKIVNKFDVFTLYIETCKFQNRVKYKIGFLCRS